MSGGGLQPSQLSAARRDELIEEAAQRIEALGLTAPAILLLEAHKPLGFLGSQALIVLQPLLGFAINVKTSQEYSALLEQSDSVELLIRRLERQADNGGQSSR